MKHFGPNLTILVWAHTWIKLAQQLSGCTQDLCPLPSSVTFTPSPNYECFECLILFKLSLGYAKQYPDQQFIWRLHPLLNFDDIRKHGVSLNSLPSNIHLSENSLDDDIQKCDSALYRGSTAIVNAINAGLKPIYYKQSTDELSIDPIYQQQQGKDGGFNNNYNSKGGKGGKNNSKNGKGGKKGGKSSGKYSKNDDDDDDENDPNGG